MTFQIPAYHFGGEGPLLHFAHANAYPPGCFKAFANHLTPHYTVFGLEGRALWPNSEPDPVLSWGQVADDLITGLDQHQAKGVIGMGISMGAVATMLAAVKRPDLFQKLILIDPVFLSPFYVFADAVVPFDWLSNKKMADRARHRKNLWPDREAVFTHYRPKSVFKRFPDETLRDFIEHGTKETESGEVTLTYPPAWEALFYASPPRVWRPMGRLKTETAVIRGELSDVFSKESLARVQRILPKGTFVEMAGVGHMIPLEEPKALAEQVLTLLSD